MKKFYCLSLPILLLLSFTSGNVFCEIENLGNPLKNLFRGSRLFNGEDDFKQLKEMGVTHIVNLEFKKDDETLCSKYEMTCIHKSTALFPWIESLHNAPPTIIDAYWTVKKLLKDDKKVYVHCHWGSDRTGLLIGALRIAEMKKGLGEKSIPRVHLKALLSELAYHKHHVNLFPGIKIKISHWTKNTPQWFFLNKTISTN